MTAVLRTRLIRASLVLIVCGLLVVVAGPRPATAANYSLTLKVDPVGKGTVDADPAPPYSQNQVVTLTATPITGWQFDRWTLAEDGNWGDTSRDYRVPVSVGAAGYARKNKVVDVDVNFTSLWTSLGKTGTLDPNSVRVIEVDGNGDVIDGDVPFQFDKAGDYNASTKAAGTVVFLMKGNTAAGATRTYHIYFDVTGKGFTAPSFTSLITVTDNVVDEDQASFKVESANATLFYHKKGAGFSSVNDADGNDWVSYSTAAGAAGEFRGIPNMVTPNNGGHFHPGAKTSESTLVSQGPLKITVYSIKPKLNTWEATWEFYPTYATMTLTKAAYDYWFLYEGTPGGKLDLNSDFLVRSDGTQTLASQSWTQDIANEEWAYVADPTVGRAIFFASHTDDTRKDSYVPSDGVMTRFGFGRDGGLYLIDKTILPRQFTFGLMNETLYDDAKVTVNNAYKDLDIALAAAQARAGASLGSNNPVEFTITGNHTITAVFKPAQYTLTVNVAGQGSVTRTPNKAKYDFEEQVTLEATPSPGWVFTGWSGDLSGTTNPAVVTMTANKTVTATFAQSFTVTASANPTAGGSVTVDPNLPSYLPNQEITVTAVANPGYGFTGWSGDLSGSNPSQKVTVTKNLNIVANFGAAQYTFNATSAGNGSVDWTPKKASYSAGEQVTVTATPANGYAFVGWSGTLAANDNPLVVTIAGDTSLIASFTELVYYSVNVTTVGSGTVTKDPDLAQYAVGTKVTLTATPDAEWRLAGWSGGVNSTDNPLEIVVTGDTNVTATFEPDVYPINVTIVGSGVVSKAPDKPGYSIGEQVLLAAIPQTGWDFTGWSGDATGTDSSVWVTVQAATNVTATFTAQGPFNLTTAAQGNGTINVSPVKPEYFYGDKVTLTATPGPGYVFAGWTGDLVSNANPAQVTMNGDKTITGVFVQPTGPFTDAFNACTVAPRWTFIDPLDEGSVQIDGYKLKLSVPGGVDHNIWKNGNDAPRVMQAADNTDFEIGVKFDSAVTQPSQMQGLLVEQDAGTFLRFDFNYNSGETKIFAASFLAGKPRQQISVPIPAAEARYLRVTRVGDKWTPSYSGDGQTWVEAGTFTFKLVVSKVGVFVGNVGTEGTAPAHTAVVDYFYNKADPAPTADQPLLDITVVGAGQVQTTPPLSAITCAQTVQLKAMPGYGAVFSAWSGDLTGTQNPATLIISRPRAVTATFAGNGMSFLMLPVVIGDN